MGLNEANEPDEKTLALLLVIAEMLDYKTGPDGLATKYQRAIDNIRWKKAGSSQQLRGSPEY
jgi:hypothetical protein